MKIYKFSLNEWVGFINKHVHKTGYVFANDESEAMNKLYEEYDTEMIDLYEISIIEIEH